MAASSIPTDDPFPKSISASAPATLAGHTLSAAEQAAYESMFLDTSATLAANASDGGCPYTGEALLEHCRWCMVRLFQLDDYSVLASDFAFRGPVVGPVGAAELRDVFARFRVRDALRGSPGTAHNLWIDPHCPARVFWVTVTDAVHNAQLGPYAPTGRRVRSPPQVASFTFGSDGKVKLLTAGYVLDRDVGNTGGMGALFGILYAIGHPLPMPEGRPYVKSWQFRLLELVDRFTKFFGRGNKSPPAIESSKQDIPEKKTSD